jgi:hypothetical protein
MYDDWLSETRGPCKTEVTLTVACHEELYQTTPSLLLQNNLQRQIINDHIWVSVGAQKETVSAFTRMERLSACLSILFLTMIANAMWYQNSNQEEDSSAVTIGPISIGVRQLFTSIASSLIVVPPVLVITQLFVLSERSKPATTNTSTADNVIPLEHKSML